MRCNVRKYNLLEKFHWSKNCENYEKLKKFLLILSIEWSFFQCQIVNIHPIKNILHHCRLNIFNSTQYKFQFNRIISLQVTMSANLQFLQDIESINCWERQKKIDFFKVSHWYSPLKLLTILIWEFAIFWSWQLTLWNLGQLAPVSFFYLQQVHDHHVRDIYVVD